jgi:hypothetical protein
MSGPGTMPRWANVTPLLCCIVLSSCSARTDRAPSVTLLDFKAQNVERLHDGIARLVGEDSAGLAAREYIRAFEEDLAARIPTKGAMPAPITSDRIPTYWEDPRWMEIRREALEKSRAINDIPLDPKLLELKHYLDGRKAEAIGELRRRNEAFRKQGDPVSATMGLAASYVAISCANEPGDVETITRLVEPLLDELTKK